MSDETDPQAQGFIDRAHPTGVSPDEVYHDEIEAAMAEGLLEQTAGRLRLTTKGHLLGNRVFVRFV